MYELYLSASGCLVLQIVLSALKRTPESEVHGCQVGIFNAIFGKKGIFQNLFISKNAIKCQIMPFWHFFMY